MKKALFLTIKSEFFDLIASGKKTIEYRAKSAYWKQRLSRVYDEVIIRNGYRLNSPVLRAEFAGINRRGKYFKIKIGKILEINNFSVD